MMELVPIPMTYHLVSIAPVSANPIIEGGIAQFTLTATEAVDTPYTVEIGLTNTGGDFIDRISRKCYSYYQFD